MPKKPNNSNERELQNYDEANGRFLSDDDAGGSKEPERQPQQPQPSEEDKRKAADKNSPYRQYFKDKEEIAPDTFKSDLSDMMATMLRLYPNSEAFGNASTERKKQALLIPKNPDFDPNDITKGFTKVNKDAYDGTDRELGSDQDNYTINCQLCAPCGELYFRGYAVDAGAHGLFGSSDYFSTVRNRDNNYINSMALFGLTRENAVNIARDTPLQKNHSMDLVAENDMKRIISGQPDGSRFLLTFFYKYGGGHIVNIINDHGKPKVVDFQPGRLYELGDGAFSSHFSTVNPKSISIIRVDDKDIDDRQIDYFVDRKAPSNRRDMDAYKARKKTQKETSDLTNAKKEG